MRDELPNNTEGLLCPDLSYIEPLRRAAMPLRGSYLVGAPDLAIEIASPNDTRPEIAAKVGIYLQAGVRLVRVAWPGTRTIDFWRPSNLSHPVLTLAVTDTLDGSDVVLGFVCPVRDLFGP